MLAKKETRKVSKEENLMEIFISGYAILFLPSAQKLTM
jgi:hypothetical protein